MTLSQTEQDSSCWTPTTPRQNGETASLPYLKCFYMFQYDKWIFMTVMLLTHGNLGTITTPRYSPTELLPCQLLLVCVGNIPKHSNLSPSTPKWLNPKVFRPFIEFVRTTLSVCSVRTLLQYREVKPPKSTWRRLPEVNTLPLDIPKSCLFSRGCEGKCSSTPQHSGTFPTPTCSQLPKY